VAEEVFSRYFEVIDEIIGNGDTSHF